MAKLELCTNSYRRTGLIDRLSENSVGFWTDNQWYIIIFTLAIFCDALSTTLFMVQLGPDIEIHPIIRIASRVMGPYLGPLTGFMIKLLAGFYVTIYLRRWAKYIFTTAAIISFWAAWYNIWGTNIEGYTPNILEWPNVLNWMNF